MNECQDQDRPTDRAIDGQNGLLTDRVWSKRNTTGPKCSHRATPKKKHFICKSMEIVASNLSGFYAMDWFLDAQRWMDEQMNGFVELVDFLVFRCSNCF